MYVIYISLLGISEAYIFRGVNIPYSIPQAQTQEAIQLPTGVSVCLSVHVSVCLFVHVSVCLCMCVCLYVCACVCMSVRVSVCLCLSVCLSVYDIMLQIHCLKLLCKWRDTVARQEDESYGLAVYC